MFKGLRHTITCSKCGETTEAFENLDDAEKAIATHKSKCCNADFKYIGQQPYHESILRVPFEMTKNQTTNNKEEKQMEEMKNMENANEEIKAEEAATVETETKEETTQETNVEVNDETAAGQAAEVLPETQEETKDEEPAQAEPVTASPSGLTIDQVVTGGSKGVTNAQMIPAMKKAITEGSLEKINLLKQVHPAIFDSSIKYIGKKMQDKLTAMLAGK